MKYELAKQLKEAGFPKETFFITYPNEKYPNQKGQRGTPTLEELIEACGEKDFHIHLIQNHTSAIADLENIYWSALKIPARGDKKVEIQAMGDTPTEAVAKLWLKLQEKRK